MIFLVLNEAVKPFNSDMSVEKVIKRYICIDHIIQLEIDEEEGIGKIKLINGDLVFLHQKEIECLVSFLSKHCTIIGSSFATAKLS